MDFHQFFAFAQVLQESINLLCRNRKLRAFVTTLSLVSSSLFVFFFDIPLTSFMSDNLAKESLFPIVSSITRKNDSPSLLVFFGFVFFYFVISFFSMTASIVVSSESHKDNGLSLKVLSLRIFKCCIRPFLTMFYTTIFALGYVYSALYMATPRPVFYDISNVKSAVLFCVFAYVLYLYLSSVWIMSLVVSVVEEDGRGGISTLGKSAEVIKGQKINAFFMNVVSNLIVFAVYLCSNAMIEGGKFDKIYGFLLVNFSCLMRIFTFEVYTVLYFRCMESRETPLIVIDVA